MTLYRLFEINQDYIEVIGLYQDRDIAQKTIAILPEKPYKCTYGIDTVDIMTMDIFNRVMCPSENIYSHHQAPNNTTPYK